MRAPGEPQGVFALESHLDEVARQMGMDPLDFRLKNLIVEGEETADGRAPRARPRHRDAGGRRRRRRLQDAEGARTSAAASPSATAAPAAARARRRSRCSPTARVVIGTPIFDQGTGTYTILQQVVAEELERAAGHASRSRSGTRTL